MLVIILGVKKTFSLVSLRPLVFLALYPELIGSTYHFLRGRCHPCTLKLCFPQVRELRNRLGFISFQKSRIFSSHLTDNETLSKILKVQSKYNVDEKESTSRAHEGRFDDVGSVGPTLSWGRMTWSSGLDFFLLSDVSRLLFLR